MTFNAIFDQPQELTPEDSKQKIETRLEKKHYLVNTYRLGVGGACLYVDVFPFISFLSPSPQGLSFLTEMRS